MVEKLKLLGIGKSEKHNYFIFNKEQPFFQLVRELLKSLGFEKYDWGSFGRPVDEKYQEPIYDKEQNIKKHTDKRFAFKTKELFIEIIFGKDKVFLLIHTDKDMQEELSKFMKKYILV